MLREAIRNFMVKRTISAKLRNQSMNMFSNFDLFNEIRVKAEEQRKQEGRSHEVFYFHKVDDPYSHLTIQYIEKLNSSFDINLKPILVGDEDPKAVHEPSLYGIYCLEDAKRIAPFYGVEFSADSYPRKELIDKSNTILSLVEDKHFAEVGTAVSNALWHGHEAILDELGEKYTADEDFVKSKIAAGNQIRSDKGYYFGSAFYYEKELYWGVDRINHLEHRLSELGLKKDSINEPICAPKITAPEILKSDKKVNLTFYPSLNSPYTYVSAKRVREITHEYPVNLITRPVLPMLMRNMTIPPFKAKYIISDAAREGRKYDYPMGSIYSPIGKPARKAYSLFPIIDSLGKGFEYIDDLLYSSFHEGINIGDDDYLKSLIKKLNLDWDIVGKELGKRHWKKVLADNLKDMYAGNCWGVPSFKVTNSDETDPFYVWGQDRMWLLKEEINKRLGKP